MSGRTTWGIGVLCMAVMCFLHYREFRDAGDALTMFGLLVIGLTIRHASNLARDE